MKKCFANKPFYIIAITAIVFTAIAATLVVVSNARKTNLALWKNESDRIGLLPYLLQEEPRSIINRKALSSNSPIYGMSKSSVISLLGPPDQSYGNDILYNVGNVDGSVIGNLIVPQNAILYLHFVNNKCAEYSIDT